MIATMLEFCHVKAVKTLAAYSGNQWGGQACNERMRELKLSARKFIHYQDEKVTHQTAKRGDEQTEGMRPLTEPQSKQFSRVITA
ncbi:hypothetical protein [Lelliottia amnigena]|uniref:hypothetical protein n=1 Tax=Lelliottia amnigena TaxID=61646 RepID=UPI0040560754